MKFKRYSDDPECRLVTCPRCRSIWTPGTLSYGFREQKWDTTSGLGRSFGGIPVPIHECPGCQLIEDSDDPKAVRNARNNP